MIIGVQLLLGFVLLYYGARALVDGACMVAERFSLPKSFVGLTIVAFGTSAPELIVNLLAATRNHTDLALSNVAGSNLTNLCLGFGAISLMSKVVLKRVSFQQDFMLAILAPGSVLLMFIIHGEPQLPFWTVIPFGVAVVYYVTSLRKRSAQTDIPTQSQISIGRAILYIVVGVALLYIGGEFVFRNAVTLAQRYGLAESTIGLTIVACGTSIPDVAASIIAAARKENDIAVGNLLGSNISNVIVVLGATVLVSGTSLPATQAVVIDYAVVVALTFGFASVGFLWQRSSRLVGVILLAAFALYYAWRLSGV